MYGSRNALKSATRAQLQAKILCKTSIFIPTLRAYDPVPESIRKSSHDCAPRQFQSGESSHEQSDSDESPDDLEKSTEWNNEGRLAARSSPSSSQSARARSSTCSSSGQVRILVALCKQAEASAHVAHPTRQAASAGGALRPAGAAKRKASTSKSSTLSGQVNKRRSLPNSCFKI